MKRRFHPLNWRGKMQEIWGKTGYKEEGDPVLRKPPSRLRRAALVGDQEGRVELGWARNQEGPSYHISQRG